MSQVNRLVLDRSLALGAQARRFIPGVTQTTSKRPEAFAPGAFPDFIERGQGSHVWDVDGNEYVDFVMACGPVTLGYCYPAVDRAIQDQLRRGIIFSRPTALEGEVAELLAHMVPCAETTRFFKGGAEANSAALRLARAYTGRSKVASCGYRGWHDQWAVTHTPAGIPTALQDLILEFRYNDLASLAAVLEANRGQVAAVILDAVSGEKPEAGFLAGVQDLAHRYGALLIFDEIVTGFRLAAGGAQQYYGVTPDLAVFAKGIANGMPLSAVCGRRDVMAVATEVFMTLTYGDEQLSLAAARAALNEIRSQDVCGHIRRIGERLAGEVQAAIDRTGVPFACRGEPAMPGFVATGVFRGRRLDDQEQGRAWYYLLAELAQRGILWRKHSLLLPSYSHSIDDVDRAAAVCSEVFGGLAGLLEDDKLHEAVPTTELPVGFQRL
jgi:glutamate-1-semialdehyde aminotransferase